MKRCWITWGLLLNIWTGGLLIGQTWDIWESEGDISRTANNLLYAINVNADPDQPQYFLPTIENILKNLRFADRKRTIRFKEIENANRLKEDANISNYISTVFEDYILKQVDRRPSESRTSVAEEISDYIKSYDEFLYIKINAGQLGFIEFQFYRYEILKDTTFSYQIDSTTKREWSIIDLPVHKYAKRSSSVFINLQDESNNQIIALRNAISQVFDETNQPPEALIVGNGRMYNDTMFFALGDTIKLKAEIFDPDSRKELFSYEWRQMAPEERVPGFTLTNNLSEEQLIIPFEGCYKVGVKVNDGIQDSEEEEMVFCIARKPTLILSSVAKEEPAIIAYQSYLVPRRKRFMLQGYQLLDGIVECKDTSQLSIEIIEVKSEQHDRVFEEEPKLQLGNRLLTRRLPYNILEYDPVNGTPYYVNKYFNLALNTYDRDSINYYFGCFYVVKDLVFDSDHAYDFYLYSQFSPYEIPKPGLYEYKIRLREKALKSDFVPLKVNVIKALPARIAYGVNFGANVPDTLVFNGDTTAFSGAQIFSVYAGLDLKVVPHIGLEIGTNYFLGREGMSSSFIPYARGYLDLNEFISMLPKRRKRKYLDLVRFVLFYEIGHDIGENQQLDYSTRGASFDLDYILWSFNMSFGRYRSEYYDGLYFSVGLSHPFFITGR